MTASISTTPRPPKSRNCASAPTAAPIGVLGLVASGYGETRLPLRLGIDRVAQRLRQQFELSNRAQHRSGFSVSTAGSTGAPRCRAAFRFRSERIRRSRRPDRERERTDRPCRFVAPGHSPSAGGRSNPQATLRATASGLAFRQRLVTVVAAGALREDRVIADAGTRTIVWCHARVDSTFAPSKSGKSIGFVGAGDGVALDSPLRLPPEHAASASTSAAVTPARRKKLMFAPDSRRCGPPPRNWLRENNEIEPASFLRLVPQDRRTALACSNRCRSREHHDELLFIIIHQVYELWFRQLLHEIDAAMRILDRRRSAASRKKLPPHPRDPASPGAAGRRPGDDDAAGVQRVSRPAQPRQRVPIGAVPRDRVPVRRARVRRTCTSSSRRARTRAARSAVWRDRRSTTRSKACCAARLRGRHAGGAAEQPSSRSTRIRSYLRSVPAARRLHRVRRAVFAVARPPRAHGRAHDRHKMGTGGSLGVAYLAKTLDSRFFPELWDVRTLFGGDGYGYGKRKP